MSYLIPSLGHDFGNPLPDGGRAWPIDWEQHVDESCAHHWEVTSVKLAGPREAVVRCRYCHVPRCGHSNDRPPCMERRHHEGLHIYVDGSFGPVGGLLASDGEETP